ncbi:unnamed protein product [Oncorhynchus mykiss]|uniref:GDNF/GAS1 domain-containing protein n=1 Tax=Oncorhynchus mykiss TaxID=8022 RepID=A0A060XTN8_ONCMY|nr:unnamed protein product [Oncorhynchus mykiss]
MLTESEQSQSFPSFWVSHSGQVFCHCCTLSLSLSLNPTPLPDSSLSKANPCSEPGKPCNPCLDAAKACNLNETCKRQRSNYIAICNKPPQPSQANQEPCSRKRCHKALRQFFERVSWELSYPLLFCSCPDQACAERRRQTIVPACSHQEKHRPSCLELRRNCRSDALCR